MEYLEAENAMLQERLKGRRLRFSDAERALLGQARCLSRETLINDALKGGHNAAPTVLGAPSAIWKESQDAR
jgi:hypothetical protein